MQKRFAESRLLSALAGAALTAIVLSGAGAARVATPPSSGSPPTISGQAKEGETLTASSGTWSGSTPITFVYRWLRCSTSGGSCSERSSGQTYTLGSGDVGRTMRVTVTATNSDGSSSATSAATAVVTGAAPKNTSPPTLSGSAVEGQQLTINRGSWSGSPHDYDWAWQRCGADGNNCASIQGQTVRTYRLSSDDVGRTVRGVVTAVNQNGSSSATTRQSPVVTAAPRAPTNTSLPIVTGTVQEGQTLTAHPGSWAGTPPISFRYEWRRCDSGGQNCSGRSGSGNQYKLGSGDVGRTIRVLVTGSSRFGSASALSNPTHPVSPALPAGAVKLPSGLVSIPVTSVSLPQRLIVDQIQFSPSRIRSRDEPLVVRFHVVDTRGYVVREALVYAVGVPFDRLSKSPELQTDGDGWATITFQVLPTFALRRGNLVVIFVRARRPGDSPLAGVSTRRLVSVRVGS